MREKAEDTFALFEDIERSDGSIIPAYTTEYQLPMEGMQEIIIDPFTGEAMEAIPEEVSVQTKIPYDKPDCYPIVLRRNVSSWGRSWVILTYLKSKTSKMLSKNVTPEYRKSWIKAAVS